VPADAPSAHLSITKREPGAIQHLLHLTGTLSSLAAKLPMVLKVRLETGRHWPCLLFQLGRRFPKVNWILAPPCSLNYYIRYNYHYMARSYSHCIHSIGYKGCCNREEHHYLAERLGEVLSLEHLHP
jgi:hypothetical protein